MLEKIILSKAWNKHRVGAKLTVDSVRAKWLKDNGYIKEEKKIKK